MYPGHVKMLLALEHVSDRRVTYLHTSIALEFHVKIAQEQAVPFEHSMLSPPSLDSRQHTNTMESPLPMRTSPTPDSPFASEVPPRSPMFGASDITSGWLGIDLRRWHEQLQDLCQSYASELMTGRVEAVNDADSSNNTLLHYCAVLGYVHCVRLLLDTGAAEAVAVGDVDGRNPLQLACAMGRVAVVSEIVSHRFVRGTRVLFQALTETTKSGGKTASDMCIDEEVRFIVQQALASFGCESGPEAQATFAAPSTPHEVARAIGNMHRKQHECLEDMQREEEVISYLSQCCAVLLDQEEFSHGVRSRKDAHVLPTYGDECPVVP